MGADYDTVIAQLDENVARRGGHLDSLLADYERLLEVLRSHSRDEISHDASAVLRSLESIAAEALQVVALLNHRAGDHAAAHRAVERLKRLQQITVGGLRSWGGVK